MRRFILLSIAAAISVNAHAEKLDPKTYKCYKPEDYVEAFTKENRVKNPIPETPFVTPGDTKPQITSDGVNTVQQQNAFVAKYVRGFCKYQAMGTGDEQFNKLLRLARLTAISWSPNLGPNLNNMDLTIGNTDQTIIWWFDDENSNIAMGEMLKNNDTYNIILLVPQIKITVTLFSFEKGYERELGLNVAAYSSNQAMTGVSQNAVAGKVGNGIFNAAMSLSNPLASFLTLGINATMNSHHSEKVSQIVYSCEAGSPCNYSHQKYNYFIHNLGTNNDTIGLSVSTKPLIDDHLPGYIRLQNLYLRYGVPTPAPMPQPGASTTPVNTAPVDAYMPFDGSRDLPMRTDELYVLGGETTRADVRTGELLGMGKTSAHTQFLIMMSASVYHLDTATDTQLTDLAVPNQFKTIGDDRSYSEAELKHIPNGKYSLKEIFDSIELVCFNNLMNPSDKTKICGFHFAKMDQRYMNHRLKFKVKGDLNFENTREQFWKIGDLFKGLKDADGKVLCTSKGYYQLPQVPSFDLKSKMKSGYKLSIELDKTNGVSKKLRQKEKIVGIKFPYGYYPKDADPIVFDPKLIQYK